MNILLKPVDSQDAIMVNVNITTIIYLDVWVVTCHNSVTSIEADETASAVTRNQHHSETNTCHLLDGAVD